MGEEMKNIPWSITPEEISLASECIGKALKAGASQVRITINKSMMDLFMFLNGELDKVSHSGDRSMVLNIFADGKFGTFSTNRLDAEKLDDFVAKAMGTVRMLAEDEFRKLPSQERVAKDAVSGLEMGLYDPEYAEMDSARRLEIAKGAVNFDKARPEGYTLISEEMEYSDSVYDTYVIDSEGTCCRHTESSFEIGCECTVEDCHGHKFSGYWWDSSPVFRKLEIGDCCGKALERAVAQIGPKGHRGGKFNMVVENEVASKLLNPILNALNGSALQQQNSFLVNSLGKKIFSEGFTLMDMPREAGANGARMFDSEGVATANAPVIENGVVARYFINTYMSGKMGMEPTIEDITRAVIVPYCKGGQVPEAFCAKDMIKMLGSGIFVSGFNGGNSNAATGDFSYGIEGYAFSRGKITHPVRGMVITGNFLELWNNLYAAGCDARRCMTKLIPSLAFENVDFSA